MQLNYVIIKVDDQNKALRFYTEILGFRKKVDQQGGPVRWLTVVSPEGPDQVELVLEPNNMPPALAAQKALFEGGFPAALMATTDLDAEYKALSEKGVIFRGKPQCMPGVRFIPFEDTCGNLIMLSQSVA